MTLQNSPKTFELMSSVSAMFLQLGYDFTGSPGLIKSVRLLSRIVSKVSMNRFLHPVVLAWFRSRAHHRYASR